MWAAKAGVLALPAITLAAAVFLLVSCGGEAETPTEKAEEAAVVEEVETTESQEATEPAESEEAAESTGREETTESIGSEEAPVAVPEPAVAPAEEVTARVEPAPPAPPPPPVPTATGVSTTQTAAPDPAAVGQPLTFSVIVKNNSTTQRAALKDFLPPGVSLVSATPSQGSCGTGHHGGGTVECVLGVVPSGGSVTVGVVVTPTAPGTITNTAVALAEFAPATPANSASATVTVKPAASFGAAENHKAH